MKNMIFYFLFLLFYSNMILEASLISKEITPPHKEFSFTKKLTPDKKKTRFNLWTNGYVGNFRDEAIPVSKEKGDYYVFLVGGDYLFTPKFVGGMFLLYNKVNSSKLDNSEKVSTEYYGINPYFSFSFLPSLSLNVTLGYSSINSTRDEQDPDKDTSKANPKGYRLSVSTSLRFLKNYNNFRTDIRVGHRYNYTKFKPYMEIFSNPYILKRDESRSESSSFDVRLWLGYKIRKLLPYIEVAKKYYVVSSKVSYSGEYYPRGAVSNKYGLGFKYYFNDKFSGEMRYRRGSGRKFTSNTYKLKLKYRI